MDTNFIYIYIRMSAVVWIELGNTIYTAKIYDQLIIIIGARWQIFGEAHYDDLNTGKGMTLV